MMNKTNVRKATLNDVEAIRNIHRDCDDPWHTKEECLAWIENRLDRNFYIQSGIFNNKIVGHGEWIISSEPDNKYLYLGMLQIDANYQKKGIGREMVNDGLLHAKIHNCKYISVICDADDPIEFYKKCGFKENKKIMVSTLSTLNALKDNDYEMIESVPENVVNEVFFKFGYAQVASRHMWEVCNRKPKTDQTRCTPAMTYNNNDYIQLSYYEENKSGMVLCWSNSSNFKKLINASLYLGKINGLEELNFYFKNKACQFFNTKLLYSIELNLQIK